MKPILFFLAVTFLATPRAFAQSAEPPSADAAIPNTKTDGEIRVLPRTRPDRQYQLYIGLPASYHKEPTRKYPVVYVTDGYWNFATLRGIYWGLIYDKMLPEVIVVGIGYVGENLDYETLRSDDLIPPLRYRHQFMEGPMTGGADQFLNVIETLAIPVLEREYRADPRHRVLMGGSLGGLFTLYALLTKPQLFQGYVAASPNVTFLWQYEEEFARSGRSVDARVFVSMGGLEVASYRNEVTPFNERLASRSYVKGGYTFKNYATMRHSGAILMGFVEGLQNVCAPIAPEHGVSEDMPIDPTKKFYGINFKRTPALKAESLWSTAQKEVMHRHRQLLDDLVKEKKVWASARTPDGSEQTFSIIGCVASDQKEAEQLAAADPAVVAGLLTFDVLCLSEKPGEGGK